MLSCIGLLIGSVYRLTPIYPKCTFKFPNCSKMFSTLTGGQIEIFLSFDEIPKMFYNLALTFV